jgi:hypothetical protein
MLDVHPPHAPTHTWRDFFIHIATIVIGLLIAVGLEQAVEALVHRHERAELIESMRLQAERNLPILQNDIRSASNQLVWLQSVIDVLAQAPVAAGEIQVQTPSLPPGPVVREPSRAVWLIAKAKGTAALLPEDLAEVYDRLDYDAQNTDEAVNASVSTEEAAEALEARFHVSLSPGSSVRLSVAQRDQVVLALSSGYAALLRVNRVSQQWAASSDAVIHKVQTRAEMNPYLARAASY